MFDLEAAIRGWRRVMEGRSLSATELDELEDHLRSTYASHEERGVAPAEAWAVSQGAIGSPRELAEEYRKVRSLTWLRLLRVGWAVFVLAFFLQVHEGGITVLEWHPEDGLLPGFQAFHVAITEPGVAGALSALTNFLMLATMWRVTAQSRTRIILLAVTVSASAVLNGWWLSWEDPVEDLRIGYYMWWASFALASAALAMRARALAVKAAPVSLARVE